MRMATGQHCEQASPVTVSSFPSVMLLKYMKNVIQLCNVERGSVLPDKSVILKETCISLKTMYFSVLIRCNLRICVFCTC